MECGGAGIIAPPTCRLDRKRHTKAQSGPGRTIMRDRREQGTDRRMRSAAARRPAQAHDHPRPRSQALHNTLTRLVSIPVTMHYILKADVTRAAQAA